jgi:Protein of unknown function (DUF2637)
MRIVVRIALAVVALAAAALSYQSLAHLGVLAGYGGLSPLYPIVVDAGAAASCSAWLHTRARQPLAMTWSLLVISVVLNGTVHWLESTGFSPSWLLVVGVAAIPPLVLGLCVHLAVGLGAPGGPATGTNQLAEIFTKEPASDEAPDPVAELLEQGAGRRRIAKELEISEHAARQLLAARNGHQL